MIEITPEKLMVEIDASISNLKEIHHKAECARNMFCPWLSGAGETLENHPLDFLSTFLPNTIYDNPGVTVKTSLPRTAGELAKQHQQALERWIRDIDLAEELEPIVVDAAFSFGVAYISLENQPGYDGNNEFVPQRPRITHIMPNRLIVDPRAHKLSDVRLIGHRMVLDKNALLKNKRYNKEVVNNLPTDQQIEEEHEANSRKEIGSQRNDVSVYSVWVPEVTLTEKELPRDWKGPPPSPARGYHGTIYTIAENGRNKDDRGKARWVRDPYPFYGPPWGPYEIFGGYTVPGSPIPMSPIVAVLAQAEAFDSSAKAMQDAAESYKRFLVTESSELAAKLKAIQNGHVAAIPQFNRDAAEQFEIGGITEEMLAHHQTMKDRLDRNAGMSDAIRGQATGAATLGENQIAVDAASRRLALLSAKIMRSVSRVLRTASWYIHHSPDVVMPIGNSEKETEGLYIGGEDVDQIVTVAALLGPEVLESVQEMARTGQIKPTPRGAWWNLQIEVDAYSMRRVDEALVQKRAIEVMTMVLNLAPLVANSHRIDVQRFLGVASDATNDNAVEEVLVPLQPGDPQTVLQPGQEQSAGPVGSTNSTTGQGVREAGGQRQKVA